MKLQSINIQRLSKRAMLALILSLMTYSTTMQKADCFSPLNNRAIEGQKVISQKRESHLKMAWSLDLPSFSNASFGTSPFGTWYNEVDPTARTTYYDDSYPLEYTFATPGSDWPSAYEEEIEEEPDLPRVNRPRPLRAIRRAASRAIYGKQRKS